MTLRQATAPLGDRVKSQRLSQTVVNEPAPVNTNSTAYKFGQRDAQTGTPRKPEEVFAQEKEQREYAAGVASVPAPITDKAIIVPNYKRNGGREYVTRTEQCADAMLKLAEKHAQRVADMVARTAAEFPWAAGDILLA
jgi:hypothetical protein